MFRARYAELLAVPLVPYVLWHGWPMLKARKWLVWALALLLSSWYVSTFLSLAPQTSILGGPRGRGALFLLACVIFLLAWLRIATVLPRRQVQGWLVGCILVSGLVHAIEGAESFSRGTALAGLVQVSPGAAARYGGLLGNSSYLRDYLAVCAAIIFCVMLPKYRWWIMLAPAAFLAWTLVSPARWPAVAYRLHLWPAATVAVGESWLYGWGPATGSLVIDLVAHQAVGELDTGQDRTENYLLDAAIERGLTGVLSEVVFWGLICWYGRKSRYVPPMALALQASMVSVIPVPNLILAYCLAGLVVAANERFPLKLAVLYVPVNELWPGRVPGHEFIEPAGEGLEVLP